VTGGGSKDYHCVAVAGNSNAEALRLAAAVAAGLDGQYHLQQQQQVLSCERHNQHESA
jgi:hypothetical protein